MKKILVSIWPGLGDIMFITPALRILRKKYRNAWITVLSLWDGGGRELLKYNPNIDELCFASPRDIPRLIKKFRRERYDVGIQLSFPIQLFFVLCAIRKRVSFGGGPLWWLYPAGSNSLHASEYYLRAIDRIDGEKLRDDKGYDLYLSAQDWSFADKVVERMIRPIIVVHPGARCNKIKRWPKEKFVKLCDLFSDSSVILIGAKDEEELGSYIEKNTKASVLNLIGKTSLLQSAAIMSKSNLFIGHASGPTQLAAAMGVPIVAIYASDDKRNFGPLSKNAIVVTPHTRCAPCSHFYQWLFWGLRLRYINRCKAMDTIEVRDVRVACQKMLNA